MNIEMLMAVKERILKEPRRLNMNWVVRKDPECGTVMCIAGHTLAEAGFKVQHYLTFSSFELRSPLDWSSTAMRLLGLSPSQAERLFYPRRAEGVAAPDDRFTAEDAARAIDRLIAGEHQLW